MLSTLSNLSELPPISTDLTEFLVSQTPEKQLGITTINADYLKNGFISELAETCLTVQEKQLFDTYTFEKRQLEWLLGRICAKQSVLKLIDRTDNLQELTPMDISIDIAANGRPFLNDKTTKLLQLAPEISISHSDRRIIAIAADGYCGIDIQALTDTLFKVKSRFCSEKENTLLQATIDDELTQLGLLWVAKEAVRKCFGSFKTIGFLDMELTGIEHGKSCTFLNLQLDGCYAGVDTATVAASVEDNYCLGGCVVPKEGYHA